MEIIPVIDLMQGQVVHAKYGQRHNYQPIRSALSQSSAPLDIVKALLELYPFERLYIADLGAIQGQGNHFQVVKAIQVSFPQLEIWLDSGIAALNDLQGLKGLSVRHVIGSENIASMDVMSHIRATLGDKWILSLDFNAQGFLGHPALLEQSQYWPHHIIVMTLYKVGSQQGADLELLASLMRKKPDSAFYAAGGVRDLEDLKIIDKVGVAGALVASALHNQHLASTDIHYAHNSL